MEISLLKYLSKVFGSESIDSWTVDLMVEGSIEREKLTPDNEREGQVIYSVEIGNQ